MPPVTPRPLALRLTCVRPLGRPPRPPLGMQAWSSAADASVAVLLDLPSSWPTTGLGSVELVLSQLPDPASLAPGQLVFVLPRSAPAGAWLGRLLGKRLWASGAVRATALLAKGYSEIGAAIDPRSRQDLVWGRAPAASPPPS